MSSKRTQLVYTALVVVWFVVAVWQIVEHRGVRRAARVALIHRARDISETLGLVLRSQRRFGVISKERIESALNELIKPGELNALALLNIAGEVVVSAGPPIDFEPKTLAPTGEHWTPSSVTLMNLVDLGVNVPSQFEGTNPPIVLTFPTNRPPGARPPPDRPNPDTPPSDRPPPDGPPPDRRGFDDPAAAMPLLLTTNADGSTNATQRPRGRSRRGDGRPPFGRPFWMSEEEYQTALQRQGVHSCAMVLSTEPIQSIVARDLWTRGLVVLLTTVAAVGLGLAWRNIIRTSELEVRLVRASELNTRLREMNLAAAGLAHETKNPLNIVRGLAQMISKQETASPQIREHSREIVAETDRVTAQLNEFINYSRPREVRRAPVALGAVAAEVVRALGYDLEEKAIRLHVQPDLPAIEADEQLLRQALFNLLLNAIQAVARGGEIHVSFTKQIATEAALEIRDDGPGVPPEHRANIFKPYFTTNEKGTGLGLAVVQQIVLAHGWEIECLDNQPRGARFRISHLRLTANNRSSAA